MQDLLDPHLQWSARRLGAAAGASSECRLCRAGAGYDGTLAVAESQREPCTLKPLMPLVDTVKEP